jgi:hypothetical protein
MRTVTFAVLILLATLALGQDTQLASPAPKQPARLSPPYRLINLLPVSVPFFGQASASIRRRAELFRETVLDPHEEAFRVAPGRANEQTLDDFFRSDKNLESYIQNSALGKQMRRLSDEFPTLLYACWSSLDSQLPRLNGDVTIYLVPAPLDTVGGCVRTVGPRNVVVFGSEVIAHRLASPLRFNVFVDHELFHLYHLQVNPEIRSVIAEYFNRSTTPPLPKLYQLIWLEGLAVYASLTLNPHATINEAWVSRDPITDVEARLQQLSALVLKELDSTDKEIIRDLVFDGNKAKEIPNGTGYYLGMLVAKHLASHYRLEDLAELQGATLRDAVESELRGLTHEAPAGPQEK